MGVFTEYFVAADDEQALRVLQHGPGLDWQGGEEAEQVLEVEPLESKGVLGVAVAALAVNLARESGHPMPEGWSPRVDLEPVDPEGPWLERFDAPALVILAHPASDEALVAAIDDDAELGEPEDDGTSDFVRELVELCRRGLAHGELYCWTCL